MSLRMLLLLVGALPTFACNPKAIGTADDTPLAQFRRDLADNTKHPVRKGMEIDETALRSVILKAKDEHADEIKRRYDASIAALRDMDVPSASTHDERASLDMPDDVEAREAAAMFWALDADVEQSARRTLSMYLHVAMTQAGLPMEKISVWLGFLHTARPVTARCGQQADTVSVCVDYGGVDVFVIDVVPHANAWVPKRLRWMQKKAS
jgi:hypothetical protein